MSPPGKKDEFEIDEDIEHQKKLWLIERISRIVMAVIVLAALLGLLGHGPFSSRTLDDPAAGLVVEYQRFERSKAETHFKIRIQPGQQTSQAHLSVGQEFLDKAKVIRIQPEPAEVELSPDHITYTFNLADPRNGADLTIYYEPVNAGMVQIDMGLAGFPMQHFSQFIYP